MFQRGDIVRRKNDLSGRTRVVADARRLKVVTPHKPAPRPRHETKI